MASRLAANACVAEATRRMNPALRRKKTQGGSTFVEFALVAIAVTPFLFGLVSVGITLGRSVQAAQVTRDVGHMYGLGADFSSAAAENIVSKLAEDFDLNPTTGSAVFIFSRVATVFPAECVVIGVPCNNSGLPVFTQRLTIGNSSLRASAFGTPPSQYITSNGDIAPMDYMQQNSLIANGFENLLTQAGGDQAWMVEGFFKQPDLNFLSPGFQSTNEGTYIRVIF